MFTFKRREKVHNFDALIYINLNTFRQARGTVLHLSPRSYASETKEATLSGLSPKGTTLVGMIANFYLPLVDFESRRNLSQWYLVQPTRRRPRTHDEDNPRLGERENGQTSVWC